MQQSSERLSQGLGQQSSSSAHDSERHEELKGQAQRAAPSARNVAEQGKDRIAERAQGVARALHQASDSFRSEEHQELAGYTQSVADKLEQLAGALKGRDLATLAEDVARLARRQPALFLGGAFTAGLIAARFLKSSSSSQTSSERGLRAQSTFDHPQAPPPAPGAAFMSTTQESSTAGGYGPAPGGYGPSSPTGEHGGQGVFGAAGAGGGSGNQPPRAAEDEETKDV